MTGRDMRLGWRARHCSTADLLRHGWCNGFLLAMQRIGEKTERIEQAQAGILHTLNESKHETYRLRS